MMTRELQLVREKLVVLHNLTNKVYVRNDPFYSFCYVSEIKTIGYYKHSELGMKKIIKLLMRQMNQFCIYMKEETKKL